jgi:exopolysaccharide/PEP-CTERM locus tyrosine autokinase
MSRIEEALKKATKMRGQGNPVEAPVSRGTGMTQPITPVSQPLAAVHSHPSVTSDTSSKVIPQEVVDRVSGQHMLVSMNDIVSPAAEEFRKLKQSLVRITKRGGFHNTILVTSGTMGEGKSVTSTNLAISLAQEFDHTVLLVDADLRRPTCHNLLCLENGYGLSDCLMEGADISKGMIQTGIGKLSFLPAGTPMANPGEFLASQRMAAMLKEMKERYSDRYVIIDTPPILPFAESRILARLADMVLLVVKEGCLSKYELGETMEALSGANLAGAVYSQASQSASSNRFSGYGKNQYYYGYTDR